MRCLQTTNPSNFSAIEDIVRSYTQWVLNNQAETDPHNIDIRTEPKFELPNGEVYEGAWCRPQNDGPGLRY
jgi:glucoamylase